MYNKYIMHKIKNITTVTLLDQKILVNPKNLLLLKTSHYFLKFIAKSKKIINILFEGWVISEDITIINNMKWQIMLGYFTKNCLISFKICFDKNFESTENRNWTEDENILITNHCHMHANE